MKRLIAILLLCTTPLLAHDASLVCNAGMPTGTQEAATGFNVYRGNAAAGPFTKLNATPLSACVYDDTTVQGGTVYFYVTTAVGADGQESVNSASFKVTVPEAAPTNVKATGK